MHAAMRTPEYRIGLWREIVKAGHGGDVCDRIVRSRPVPEGLLAALIPPPKPLITASEVRVLERMADGQENGMIADDLCLSPNTVKTHVRNLMRKLGAGNRAHAVAIGFRRGLIQ